MVLSRGIISLEPDTTGLNIAGLCESDDVTRAEIRVIGRMSFGETYRSCSETLKIATRGN